MTPLYVGDGEEDDDDDLWSPYTIDVEGAPS